MFTSRQIRNRGLRAMGVQPTESYHYLVREGDLVQLMVVDEECEPHVRSGRAIIESLSEHGWYADATVLWIDEGDTQTVRLFRDGPKEAGVVECRVVFRAVRNVQVGSKWHSVPTAFEPHRERR